ncbi:MAG: AI-2E family transporter [Deinococcales bacterium]
MAQAFSKIWQYAAVRVISLLILLGIFSYFIYYTREIWTIFLLAVLLAYLAQPLIRLSEHWLKVRWFGMVLFVCLVFVFMGLLSVMVAALLTQASRFSAELPDLLNGVVKLSEALPQNISALALPAVVVEMIAQAYEALGGVLEHFTQSFVTELQNFVTGGRLIGSISKMAGDVVLIFSLIVMTIYLVLDLPRIGQSFVQAFPLPYQAVISDLGEKLEISVGAYFRGQVLIALIVGLLVGLGLALLGVPLALLLGFISAIFNLVPYLGVVVSIIPALLLAINLGWWGILGVLVVFTIANQLETHVLSPLILGRSSRLHPVTILLVILLGAKLFGLFGAIFSIPIITFLKLIYLNYYQKSSFYRKG